MNSDLGRLIRTLKERCSECNHPMQLRARKVNSLVRGIENTEEEEYKVCSYCFVEVEIPLRDRKKRIEHFDKVRYVKEPIEEKRRYSNASNNKSGGTSKGNGNSGRTGFRKSGG